MKNFRKWTRLSWPLAQTKTLYTPSQHLFRFLIAPKVFKFLYVLPVVVQKHVKPSQHRSSISFLFIGFCFV